jgi:hypothetical protein
MVKRAPYIKPSLLRLEFTADVACSDLSSCKTSTSSNGSCTIIGGSSPCDDPVCSATVAS